jgi:hypothetical protein
MPITSVYATGPSPDRIEAYKTVITPDTQGLKSDNLPKAGTSSPTTNGASGLSATRESAGRVLAQQPE